MLVREKKRKGGAIDVMLRSFERENRVLCMPKCDSLEIHAAYLRDAVVVDGIGKWTWFVASFYESSCCYGDPIQVFLSSLVAICKSRVVSKMSIKWNLKKSFQVWTHKVARETRRPNEWMVLPFLNIYKVMSISNNYIPITVTAVAVSGVLGHSAFLPCNTSNTVTNSDRIVLVLWYKDGIETPIYRFVWFDFLLVTRDIFHKLSSLFFFALIISSITIYEGN